MRLLHHDHDGELALTSFDNYEQPAYTILSHTWGKDEEEVSFADLVNGGGKDKAGYNKIRLCGEQTRQDGLQYFWVDTCCIDKSNKAELSSAIRSMFRWYQDAVKCYVYLSDVSTKKRKLDGMLAETTSEHPMTSSRWFKRGWTLQELLAPSSVEIFSREWERLGDKTSLGPLISSITGVSEEVLQEDTLARFDISERLRWRGDRQTKLKEDMAYSLSGICDVDIAPLYGEGEEEAFRRLHREIQKLKDCLRDLRHGDPKDDKKRIEETKGGLLVDSYRWVLDNASFQQWQRDPQRQLLWVKGDPGKGKTMLLCGIINELGRSMPRTSLLSYFFCQATFSHLNSATAVLRGLLYMLIDQQPLLVSHVYKKYDLAGKRLFEDANAWIALTEIWIDVLQDPGLRMGYFVIDGLDECTFDRSKLLRFIAKQSSSSSRLKWIVSSRNWPEIERSLEPATDKVLLSLELNARSISAAVKTFIDRKVSRLAEEERYDERIRTVISNYLSANANDTFLWVALACQHLEGTAKRHVTKKLMSIPLGLGSFYRRMMNGISESEDAETCRCVLATAAVLFRPVVIQELTMIVEPLEEFVDHPETVREIIQLCGSFLIMEEDTVYFVHQSAQDFLLADAKDELFPNGFHIAHQEICRRSLAVLSIHLHRDMYKLKALDASVEISQPRNPDPLVALRYPCIYWIRHLCDSKPTLWASHNGSNPTTDEVVLFLKEIYLYWVESLSLCKSMAKGVLAMEALCSLAKEMSDAQDLIDLVEDAYRFFVHSKDVIENHPLQTYASALLFSPSGSLIRRAFQHEEPNWIKIEPDMSETWCSQDLKRLLIRSRAGKTKYQDIRGEDGSQTFDDHQEDISSLSSSNNSSYLASGSFDSTVKIWNLHGRCLQTLHGHSRSIKRVDFFHHPACVGSLSRDSTYRIWDIVTGKCLHTYQCGDLEMAIALSPDLGVLAYTKGNCTTNDWPIQLWDVINDASLLTLGDDRASRIYSLAFSGDSKQLAVLVNENSVRIFDTAGGECLEKLDGGCKTSETPRYALLHGHFSVSFSNDATRLASAWGNGTIRVWDRNSGRCLHTIETIPIFSDVLFDQSGQFVLTDRGRIAIPESPDLEGCTAALNTRSPAVHGGGLSLDKKWISYNSMNLLWLPPEYRPYRSVISGNSVGVATNRKVWIFTLYPENLE